MVKLKGLTIFQNFRLRIYSACSNPLKIVFFKFFIPRVANVASSFKGIIFLMAGENINFQACIDPLSSGKYLCHKINLNPYNRLCFELRFFTEDLSRVLCMLTYCIVVYYSCKHWLLALDLGYVKIHNDQTIRDLDILRFSLAVYWRNLKRQLLSFYDIHLVQFWLN